MRAAGPEMTGPELIVPAHPPAGDACRVEFEVRAQGDGGAVPPVFSSVAALVRALGRCQPWVCVPLRVAREEAPGYSWNPCPPSPSAREGPGLAAAAFMGCGRWPTAVKRWRGGYG